MSKRKLIYVVSDIEKSLAFEWIANHFQSRFDLFFLLIGRSNTPLIFYLKKLQIRYALIDTSSSTIKKWWKVFSLIRRERPDIVHAHLWQAMLLGLSTSWILGIKRRIFTRHHAAIHHYLYPSGLKWDKLCNWLATDIVAISESVKDILIQWEQANPEKTWLIHHGFDLSYFQQVDLENVSKLKLKLGLDDEKKPVVGIIARYTEWKGIQFTIKAFGKIRDKFPNAYLLLANADGDYSLEIKECLAQLPDSCYKEIIFENDLASLYKLFDVFVHVPTDRYAEAFGQTYVEALAAGIPSVFTLSGVAHEFVQDEVNAIVVNFKNVEEIASALSRILEDTMLRDKLAREGKSAVKKFELNGMLNKLEKLYE